MRRLDAILAILTCLCAVPVAAAAEPRVAAGGAHSLALRADGTVLAWGSDGLGQLGLGTETAARVPTVVPRISGVRSTASGCAHTLALLADGTVWSWGQNTNGQLGDGSTISRSAPVPVPGLSGVVAVGAGCSQSVAVTRDGAVWQWGRIPVANPGDLSGQGELISALAPQRKESLGRAVAATGSGSAIAAVLEDGTVWSWELRSQAQPLPVDGIDAAVALSGRWSSGGSYFVALRRDGTVSAWGVNAYGVLGAPPSIVQVRAQAVRIEGLDGVQAISAGATHVAALKQDGTVWTWGRNEFGALGTGESVVSRFQPAPVPGLTGVTRIAAGSELTLAAKGDGSVWAWGVNRHGEVGDGTLIPRARPVRVEGLADPASLSAGGELSFQSPSPVHSVATRADGSLWTWGSNSAGQLGNGAATVRFAPVVVPVLGNVVAIAAGGSFSMALQADGTLWAWGNNASGQLGTGRPENSASPAQVQITGVVAIAAGAEHALAVRSDGTVWAWGHNASGQLGNGTRNSTATPAPVQGLPAVSAVSAGSQHSVALTREGRAWAWGSNFGTQLGIGSWSDRLPYTRPQLVPLFGVAKVFAFDARTFFIQQDGTVWRAGMTDFVTNEPDAALQTVPGLAGASEIASLGVVTVALRSDGSLLTSGSGLPGIGLGDGTAVSRRAFARVPGVAAMRHIAASRHLLAQRDDGSVFAFGTNSWGQLGDGTSANRPSLVVVLNVDGAGSLEGGDWFLDLDPSVASRIPLDRNPSFLVLAQAGSAGLNARIRARPQDIGRTGNYYVFALAPASSVGPARPERGLAHGKDAPAACVLAQLSDSGQLQAVLPSNLTAAGSGLLTAQGQAVTVLGAAGSTAPAGTTYFVGYGSNAASMISEGTNRSVASIPGAQPCEPQKPQTGWWWNPAEPGRGYSIEVQGERLFFGAFLYDVSGRSTWYVAAGPTSLEGSYFSGALWSVANGQTLAGAYDPPDPVADEGPLVLSFTSATRGTLVWPGGSVPIERFDIVPGGLAAEPHPEQPEKGWWWNEAESGRGFFIEWQNGSADLVGYMYDEAGKPVWYLSVYETPDPARFSGNWWSYANGQPLVGAWRVATRVNDNVAPVAITFSGPETAVMTLPGGRTTNLTRMRF